MDRRLGLDKALPKGPERRAKLILAMIVARVVEPAAKLATARQLSETTAAHSLGAQRPRSQSAGTDFPARATPTMVL